MQPAGLHTWYFRSCIAKRRLVCEAMRLRGAFHSSLGGIACVGINLPAWLQVVLLRTFSSDQRSAGLKPEKSTTYSTMLALCIVKLSSCAMRRGGFKKVWLAGDAKLSGHFACCKCNKWAL